MGEVNCGDNSERNYGDCKSLGDGVLELRFHFGIRVYFAEIENTVVLLLSGGDKSSQFRDISKAKDYFSDYKSRCGGRKV